MKKNINRITVLCISLLLVISILPLTACTDNTITAKGLIIYVSPNGSDQNSGTEDAPLATMAGARDMIRTLKADGELPDDGITVYFRGGTYRVTQTTYFTEEDSGSAEIPITYSAYPGETPVFSGGIYLSSENFSPVSDQVMLNRLQTEDARQTVISTNLFDYGVSPSDLDYAQEFWQTGNLYEDYREERQDNNYIPHQMQVFQGDTALYLARYPNRVEGTFVENEYSTYLGIREIIEGGQPEEAVPEVVYPLPQFRTHEERIRNWASYEDVVIFGMMAYEYGTERIIANEIDPVNMTIELKTQLWSELCLYNRYGFENVYEELDYPGEYYIDKDTGMLYLYPVASIDDIQISVSLFDENYIIDLNGTSNITFSGLSFELTKGSIARIVGGENCMFINCIFKNFGGMGVKIGTWVISARDYWSYYDEENGLNEDYVYEHPAEEHGYRHVVSGCTFINTGYAAADITSGHVFERESGEMLFENNVIWHSGLLGGTYNSGVIINGVGITIKNNSFFFCEGQAINGNVVDTEIIYNEFCDSPCNMSEDTGTIYINYMNINDGVLIRYNYFHDVSNRDARGIGFDYRRRVGGYYDTSMPFRDFSYNVLYRMPGAAYFTIIGPSTVINNVFIDCNDPLTYPEEWLRNLATGNLSPTELIQNEAYSQWALYRTGLYTNEEWRNNYPELYEYYLYMLNEKEDLQDICDTVTNNLYVNISERPSGRSTQIMEDAPVDPKYGEIVNNIYMQSDPGFANYLGYDFQLSAEAAQRLGIEAIDMSIIGATNAPVPTRIMLPCNDPLETVMESVNLNFCFVNGEMYVPVDLWREVEPGVWQWVDSDVTNGEFAVSFAVKPGGTYAVFYQGDALNLPQYIGGVESIYPTDNVLTVTVTEATSSEEYLWYEFELTQR